MIEGFDKEIDTLLRQTAKGETAFVAQQSAISNQQLNHLDADEISAFAENALPERLKSKYTAHFADCDRCRKILSNLISLDSEAAAVVVSAATPEKSPRKIAVPWYRKFFAFPNPAYALGALVVLLGGFLAFSILQNGRNSQNADVSQISESQPTAGGPSAETAPDFPVSTATNSNTASLNMNSTAMMSNSAAASSNTSMAGDVNKAAGQTAFSNSASANITAKTAPSNQTKNETGKVLAETETTGRIDTTIGDSSAANQGISTKQITELPLNTRRLENLQAAPPTAALAKPAARSEEQDKEEIKSDDSDDSRKKARSVNSVNTTNRQIGAKTFNRRENVWYDSAYKGQGTTNVARGTDDYKKLDSGLRAIAENLSGTVVVVWKNKAYRIQ